MGDKSTVNARRMVLCNSDQQEQRHTASLISLMVSVDVKRRVYLQRHTEFRSCVKIEVDVLGFPS